MSDQRVIEACIKELQKEIERLKDKIRLLEQQIKGASA
jgi:cell division septum initiation protein DivIVA